MKRPLLLFLSLTAALTAFSQNYPYQNPQLSPEERAEDLLARLSTGRRSP